MIGRKLISAVLFAALVALPIGPAFAASSGGVPFVETPAAATELGRSTWQDLLPQAGPSYAGAPPVIFWAQIKDRFGRVVTASVLGSDASCNQNECNLRVTVDGKVVLDDMVCSNLPTLSLASDGTFVEACEQRSYVPIPDRQP